MIRSPKVGVGCVHIVWITCLECRDSNRADRFENGSRNRPREGCVDRYTACVDRHMPHLGNSADRTMRRSIHGMCRSTHGTCTALIDTLMCRSTQCITKCVVRHIYVSFDTLGQWGLEWTPRGACFGSRSSGCWLGPDDPSLTISWTTLTKFYD